MGFFSRFRRSRAAASGVRTESSPASEAISEQRKTQAQLEDSRRALEAANSRLALYLASAPLACVVWDLDQIIREWNPASERMFGYTAAEAVGRNVYHR